MQKLSNIRYEVVAHETSASSRVRLADKAMMLCCLSTNSPFTIQHLALHEYRVRAFLLCYFSLLLYYSVPLGCACLVNNNNYEPLRWQQAGRLHLKYRKNILVQRPEVVHT